MNNKLKAIQEKMKKLEREMEEVHKRARADAEKIDALMKQWRILKKELDEAYNDNLHAN